MFTPGFARMLAESARGNPAPVAAAIGWAAHLTGQFPVAANALFATLQLALGLGIAWRRTVRAALAASIAWSLTVWWLGEGCGGLLSGGESPVTGAPGAALVYALLAVLLWPARPGHDTGFPAGQAVGAPAARLIWLALWAGLGWLSVAGARAAGLAALAGPPGSLLLAAALGLIAVGILLPPAAARVAVVAAAGLAMLAWAAGQDFGGVFTGMGTDPGTGPALALLALSYWPSPAPAGLTAPAGSGTAGHRRARPAPPAAGADVTVMQVMMGAGMAGLLVQWHTAVPLTVVQALAAAGMAWFGWRCARDLRAPARGAPPGLRHLPHVLGCAAMLYMTLGVSLAGPAGAAAVPGMAMAGASPVPAVALVLAAALAGYAAWTADCLPPGSQAAGEPAAASVVMPRLAGCCQIGMGVAMAWMLVQML